MAQKDELLDESEFDRLLKEFINNSEESEDGKAEDDEAPKKSEEYDDFSTMLAEAKEEMEQQENAPKLGMDESELAQAFVNYSASIKNLCKNFPNETYEPLFDIDDLYPNYKPSIGEQLLDDLSQGWLILCRMYPDTVGKFSVNSTDEQFLNFAEKLDNQDLQLAVISYVEILIDIEACELSYQTKFIKHQEKRIKKQMYEEYLYRKERQRLFTKALQDKKFPIDAEKLITNYFRVAQKDADGAFKTLTENPAAFSPIDFSKIKPKLFGLIKVCPRDGIKINIKIGNFLKKLRV